MRVIFGIVLLSMFALVISVLILFFIFPEKITLIVFVLLIALVVAVFSIDKINHFNIFLKEKKIKKGKTNGITLLVHAINKSNTNKVYVSRALFICLTTQLQIDYYQQQQRKLELPTCTVYIDNDMKNDEFKLQPIEPYISTIDDLYN